MCEMGLGLSDLKNLDFIWICHAPSWVGSQVQKKKKNPTTQALSLSFLERSDGCFQNTAGQLCWHLDCTAGLVW